MSTVVKQERVQSHDRYVRLTRDVMWLNLTLFNQNALFTVIRELEFALIQLTHQVDELHIGCATFTFGKVAYVCFES